MDAIYFMVKWLF